MGYGFYGTASVCEQVEDGAQRLRRGECLRRRTTYCENGFLFHDPD
jgi:hypothetical protein